MSAWIADHAADLHLHPRSNTLTCGFDMRIRA
jgi:hypothetical protein